MNYPPIKLRLLREIFLAVNEVSGTIMAADIQTKEADKETLEQYFTLLEQLELAEIQTISTKAGDDLAIKSLTEEGKAHAQLFEHEEVVDRLIQQFGEEVKAKELGKLKSVGEKLLLRLEKENTGKGNSITELSNETLTIGQAKQRMIDFAKAQIPLELRNLVRIIPNQPTTNEIHVLSSDSQSIKGVLEEMEQKQVSVRVDRNENIPGIEPLHLYQLEARNGDRLNGFINDPEEDYFKAQETLLSKNLEVALNHKKSSVALLIAAYQERVAIHEDDGPDYTIDNPKQQTKADSIDESDYPDESLLEELSEVQEAEEGFLDELKNQTSRQEFAKKLEEEEPVQPSPPAETINNPLQLAHLNSDTAHSGKDLLGFEQDVEAFAAIMALEKLTPPLAIALFGQWGTGKSFFMQKLSEKVEELARYQGFLREETGEDRTGGDDDQEPFCKGICQIHFNAWSYMDTNLWASLVTRIFEGLDDYINENRSAAEKEKDSIKSGIAQQLDVAKGQLAELEARKAQVQDAITTLKCQVDKAQGQLDAKIAAIQNSSREATIRKALKDKRIEESLREVLDKAGITQEKLDEINPDLILAELKSAQTFAHQLLKFSPKDWLWVAAGVLLLVVPGLIAELTDTVIFTGLEKAGAILTLVVGMLTKVRGTAGKLSPLVNGVLNIKNDYDAAVAEAIANHKQDILAKQIEAEQKEVELNQLNAQLKAKEAEIKGLDYSTESVLAQKAMYNFITRKAGSSDYSKHLGIISMIRKDFQTLSELFVESAKAQKVPEKDKEKYKEFEKIRGAMEPSLNRIILYIDDLDRCQEDRVVEVLEAVNLLMAFPLFVVVVGVDPRWVKNALTKKYHLQFTGRLQGSDKEIEGFGMEVINPSDYLEKIFQIPFHLKAPEDASIKNMITYLLGEAVAEKPGLMPYGDEQGGNIPEVDLDEFVAERSEGWEAEVEDMVEEEAGDIRLGNFDDIPDTAIPAMAAMDEDTDEEETDEAEVSQEASENEPPPGLRKVTPASLKLHWEEGEYMRNLSWLIGNTPRTVKRFVNMYRIIRAHEGLSYENDEDKKDLFSIMFILALRTGPYSIVSDKLLGVIGINSSDLTVEGLAEEEIDHYRLMQEEEVDGLNLKDSKTYNRLNREKGWEFDQTLYGLVLNEVLNNESLVVLRSVPGRKLSDHNQFIKRFSFKNS